MIDVDGLRESSDIVAITSHYTALKKRGSEYVGQCLWHSPDHNPSMWVVPQTGKKFIHCFSCGAHGSVIDVVMQAERVDFSEACRILGAKTDWQPRVFNAKPISRPPDRTTSKPPNGTPEPKMWLPELGVPSITWEYKDADGALLGYCARYETAEGKTFRFWSWGGRGAAAPRWECGHWSGKRYLYGLPKLAARPTAPVLIIEGEKAADKAQELLPAYVVVTWPGGAQAWHKADWEPLRGRTALLWPDNDAPGEKCMKELAEWLADPRTYACTIEILETTGMPDGYDAADWTGTTEELIAWARPRKRAYKHAARVEEPPALDISELPPDYDEEEGRSPVNGKRHNTSALGPVLYRCMSDIKPERTVWLWPDRIACGEISLLTGNPGLGKSQITASLTSIVTNGGTWPVDRTPAKQGSVIILSAEDNTSKTMRPRLDAAGADVSKVFVLDAVRHLTPQGEEVLSGFSLSEDIAKLGHLINELGDVRLVVIDPISAYLGDIDSHNNAEVRGMLAPLQKIAEAHDTAILCVTHQNKSSGTDALLRVQASIGFAAAARAVWGVAKDKDNPQRRYFMALKNNLGKDNSGLAYSIESFFSEPSDPDADKIPTSRVLWEAEHVTVSAEEVFSSSNLTHDENSALLDAKLFLRSLLADGPVESKQIEIDARGAGHSMATLRRAADEMKVRRARDGFGPGARWKWSL